VDFAAVQSLDDERVHIHPDDFYPVGGKGGGGGKSDIAQSKHTDFVEFHIDSLWRVFF
jgi:hypothetical protein